MANLATAEYTKQISPNPKDRLPGTETSSPLRWMRARYTSTGAEAAADVLYICKLPIGARVVPHLIRVSCEAMGGTGTTLATIGDLVDADRYSATAVTLTSAANLAVTPTAAIGLDPHTIIEGTDIITATLGLSSGSVTADKDIEFLIPYLDHP